MKTTTKLNRVLVAPTIKPASAWATRSELWRSRVETASLRRTKRAKSQSALILAGHGVSLRIRGGVLKIRNGLTHYPQQEETYLFFRSDADLPERVILLDGSGSISFDGLSWLQRAASQFDPDLLERRNYLCSRKGWLFGQSISRAMAIGNPCVNSRIGLCAKGFSWSLF